MLIGNFSYVQVQTGEQDDVAHSSDDEAKGPEAEELSETARTLFSLIFSDLVDISSRQRFIIDNVREVCKVLGLIMLEYLIGKRKL